MIPSFDLFRSMLDLLAADPDTLNPLVPNKVALIAAPFIPARGLLMGDLTLATFAGSAAKASGAGPCVVAYDSNRGKWYIRIPEPAGGWSWQCTAAPEAAETVFGFALHDSTGAALLGSALLLESTVIAAEDDSVQIPYVVFYENELFAV